MKTSNEIYNTAEDYYYGTDDIAPDYGKAYSLYMKSLELGNNKAYLKLGRMYRKGTGVEKDDFMTYTLFSSGIESGYLECHAEMAMSYILSDNIVEAAVSLTSYFELTPVGEIDVEYAYFYLALVIEYDIKLRHTYCFILQNKISVNTL